MNVDFWEALVVFVLVAGVVESKKHMSGAVCAVALVAFVIWLGAKPWLIG